MIVRVLSPDNSFVGNFYCTLRVLHSSSTWYCTWYYEYDLCLSSENSTVEYSRKIPVVIFKDSTGTINGQVKQCCVGWCGRTMHCCSYQVLYCSTRGYHSRKCMK